MIARNIKSPVMRSLPLALCVIVTLNILAARAEAQRVEKAVPANSGPSSGDISSSVVLRPNDVFQLRLSGMPADDASQFAGDQTVGSDGQVNILYVGRIQAGGRTSAELERAIEKALVDKKIFRWPTATVNIATQLRYVTVGGTRQPGRVPWSADLTVLSAIMAQAGPTDFSGDKIHLIRGGKVTVYSYKKLRRDPSQDPKLLPGDSVELQ
jgi:protein involved in polysaccharide export with SLBB domain